MTLIIGLFHKHGRGTLPKQMKPSILFRPVDKLTKKNLIRGGLPNNRLILLQLGVIYCWLFFSMNQGKARDRTGKRAFHAVIIITLLVVLLSLPTPVDSTRIKSGYQTMSPGQVSRITIGANAGDQVTLTYEVSLRPIEFALIELHGLDRDDFPVDTNLNSVHCLYHKTAVYDVISFDVYEDDSDFLLFARNIANVTQEYEYEWVSINPEEEAAAAALVVIGPSVLIAICGFFVLVCRKWHQQLLRNDPSRDSGLQDTEMDLTHKVKCPNCEESEVGRERFPGISGGPVRFLYVCYKCGKRWEDW
ncbi:MAG: hypothetical protein ACFFAZ_04910 [Promethearchaeota archaeon]